LIRQVEALLEDAGGHELAAGFSVTQDNLEKVKTKLLAIGQEQIEKQLLQPGLKVEFDLGPDLINPETVQLVDQLKPFGMGNFPPVFGLKQLKVVDAFQIGKANKHLKMALKPQDGNHHHFKAIGWNKGKLVDQLKPGKVVSVAASLEMNHWQGRSELQLKIKDINSDYTP
jgi:single-stranded-DNA-specific exonuclease